MAKKQVSSTPGTCPKCGRKLAMVYKCSECGFLGCNQCWGACNCPVCHKQ